MQHSCNEMQNVRMPRACKNIKPYYQENARQTRQTRATVQQELLQQKQQQSAVYHKTTPEQYHSSAYTMPDQRLHINNGLLSDVQQIAKAAKTYAPTSQTHNARQTRQTRATVQQESFQQKQQQSAVYHKTTPEQYHYSAYTMPDARQTRQTRATVQQESLQQKQQQSAVYHKTTPEQYHCSAYTMPDLGLHINNGLLPDAQQIARAAETYAPTSQPHARQTRQTRATVQQESLQQKQQQSAVYHKTTPEQYHYSAYTMPDVRQTRQTRATVQQESLQQKQQQSAVYHKTTPEQYHSSAYTMPDARQTRQTRATVQQESLQQKQQQSAVYHKTTPEQYHSSAYTMPEQRLHINNGLLPDVQQITRAAETYEPTSQPHARQTRQTRATVQQESLQQKQQQSAVYHKTTPEQYHYSAYTMPDLRLHINNGLLSDVQQIAKAAETYAPTSQPQQSTTVQYDTSSAVHNFMTDNASNMGPYWHPSLSTQRAITSPIQQTTLSQPIQTNPNPIENQNQSQFVSKIVQTETLISEEEMNFLEMLRKRQLDAEKIYSIIKKSDYVIVFEEDNDESGEKNDESGEKNDESGEKNDESEQATSNEIVLRNEFQQKYAMMTAFALATNLIRRFSLLTPSANLLPALEYRPQNEQDTDVGYKNTDQASDHFSVEIPESETNENQEVNTNNQCFGEELTVQALTNENTQPSPFPGNINAFVGEQVPSTSYAIPTIIDYLRNKNQMTYQASNLQEYGLNTFRQNLYNNSNNLLHAFSNQCLENRVHHPHEWGQAPNMDQHRLPWFYK